MTSAMPRSRYGRSPSAIRSGGPSRVGAPPRSGIPLWASCASSARRAAAGVVADDDGEADRPVDQPGVAADGRAVRGQDRVLGRERLGRPVRCSRRRRRPPPCAASSAAPSRRSGSAGGPGPGAARGRRRGTCRTGRHGRSSRRRAAGGSASTDSSNRSRRSPTLAPNSMPIGVVLALEPGAADRQDRPAVADVVERRGQLGGQAGVAEGVGADHQADPDPAGQRGPRGEHGPAFEDRLSATSPGWPSGGPRSRPRPSRPSRPRRPRPGSRASRSPATRPGRRSASRAGSRLARRESPAHEWSFGSTSRPKTSIHSAWLRPTLWR